MLGRTDSRRRLLFLLLVFVVGTCALVARLAYWQVVDQQRLAAEALSQTTVTLDTPSKRGDIFDRTGTVVLATTVQRERLVAAPDQLSADQRRTTVATLAPILGLDDAGAVALRDKLTGTAKYVILRHGIDRQTGDQIRAAIADRTAFAISLEPEPERVYPQVGWRSGLEPRRPPARLRQPRGRRPVRRRAGVPVDARRPAADRRRRPRRQRPADPRRRDGDPGRPARHRPHADHRRGPPAAGRAGAAGRLDRRQGQERVGGGDGPAHRRGLRDGDLPELRRQRLQGDRRVEPVPLHRPDRGQRVRARVRVQDDDRGRRADQRHGHATDPGQGRRHAPARRAAGPRSTTPTARGWAG